MKKGYLLLLGFLLFLVQNFLISIHINVQYAIFIISVLLLGVPHGAADLLVAEKNAVVNHKSFSLKGFFVHYLGHLFLFAAILYFFPVAGNILFIFFAAFHFGETDLNHQKTHHFIGFLFTMSYGLLILGVILLPHFNEVRPIYEMYESGKKNSFILDWIELHKQQLLIFIALKFIIIFSIYYRNYSQNVQLIPFFSKLICILILLYHLPMLLGFTFYFVVWHSILSMQEIVIYLREKNTVSYTVIAKQILLYSSLAILGISIFGFSSSLFINRNTIAGYVFLGLAVLTAPHMQIMYNMYSVLKKSL